MPGIDSIACVQCVSCPLCGYVRRKTSFSLWGSVIFSPAPEVTVNDDCTTITNGLGTRAIVFIPPLVGCNFVLGL